MFSYSGYDLEILSEISLPNLAVSSGHSQPKVTISLGKVRCPKPPETQRFEFHVSDAGVYFRWPKLGAFFVRSGKEIIVEPAPGADEAAIRLPLLGTVWAVLLHQRKFFVLHASAVAVNGGGVAILGKKGQGKSTTIATLYRMGHALIADDTVAVAFDSEGMPTLLPGFPLIKLWPDAAVHSLREDPADLPQLATNLEKRLRGVTDRFCGTTVDLRSICVLTTGQTPRLQLLQPSEAIPHLIEHSYVSRYGNLLLKGNDAYAHLKSISRLASAVPVYLLERPRSVDLLDELAKLIEGSVGLPEKVMAPEAVLF
jgi:hypothetical protein